MTQLTSAGVAQDLRVLLGLDADSYDAERGGLVVELALERVETILSPVSTLARSIVLEVARRAYDNPRGLQSETVGPFTRTYSAGAVGVYLTEQEKSDLEEIASGGNSGGAFTIRPGGVRPRRTLDAGSW